MSDEKIREVHINIYGRVVVVYHGGRSEDVTDKRGAVICRPDGEAFAPHGYTAVKTSTLKWLLGEKGEFRCPEHRYFSGKPAPYFWRRDLREAMLAAPPGAE